MDHRVLKPPECGPHTVRRTRQLTGHLLQTLQGLAGQRRRVPGDAPRVLHGLHSLLQTAAGVVHPICGVRQGIQRRGEPVQGIGHSGGNGVDLLDIAVHKGGGLLQQRIGVVFGVPGVVPQGGERAGNPAALGLRAVQRPGNQIFQAVQLVLQLLQRLRAGQNGDIRFRLPHNAAHVLAAIDSGVVHASGQIPALPSGHAAYIIPHMGITNHAVVDAALHHAAAQTSNAAGVAVAGEERVRSLHPLGGLLQRYVREPGGVVRDAGVDLRAVGTLDQRSLVLPGDAAGRAAASDLPLYGTAGNFAALPVHPGDAAHLTAPLDSSLEDAVLHRTPVHTHKAPHLGGAARRRHRTGYRQVPDYGVLLQNTE